MKKLISFFVILVQFSFVTSVAMEKPVIPNPDWVTEFETRVKELKQLENPPLYFRLLPGGVVTVVGQHYISQNNNWIHFYTPSYENEQKAIARREYYYSLMTDSLKVIGVGVSAVALICAICYIKDLPAAAPTDAVVKILSSPVQETVKKVVPAAAKPVAAAVSSVTSRAVPVVSRYQLWAEAQRIYHIMKMRGRNISVDQICYLLARGINPLTS